jgi:hypothetical protein
VKADYLEDDTKPKIVDMFFRAYLLWLFRYVLFYSSQGDAMARYLISRTQRMA